MVYNFDDYLNLPSTSYHNLLQTIFRKSFFYYSTLCSHVLKLKALYPYHTIHNSEFD